MKTTGVSNIPKFGLLDFLGHPTQDPSGLLVGVSGVEPDSPASTILKPGDIITNVNDWQVLVQRDHLS